MTDDLLRDAMVLKKELGVVRDALKAWDEARQPYLPARVYLAWEDSADTLPACLVPDADLWETYRQDGIAKLVKYEAGLKAEFDAL